MISIEQKTITKNPRSTVGTMTDIGDYLRLLYATCGDARCLRCENSVPTIPLARLAEKILALPEGTSVELCAPLEKVYGDEWSLVFTDLRTRGVRRVRLNDQLLDLADDLELDEDAPLLVEAVADRLVVKRSQEKQLLAALGEAAKMGEGFLRCRFDDPKTEERFYRGAGCAEHKLIFVEREGWFFSFNEAESACVTCSGLGTYLRVHTGLLVPDPSRSILGGAFVKEAFNFDKNNGNGRMLWSLAAHYGFSLETPFEELPESLREILFWGTKGEEVLIIQPPGGKDDRSIGKKQKFRGVAAQIESWYRWYRQKGEASGNTEDWLRKVMVETVCPGCEGVRLKRSRLRIQVGGLNLHEASRY